MGWLVGGHGQRVSHQSAERVGAEERRIAEAEEDERCPARACRRAR